MGFFYKGQPNHEQSDMPADQNQHGPSASQFGPPGHYGPRFGPPGPHGREFGPGFRPQDGINRRGPPSFGRKGEWDREKMAAFFGPRGQHDGHGPQHWNGPKDPQGWNGPYGPHRQDFRFYGCPFSRFGGYYKPVFNRRLWDE